MGRGQRGALNVAPLKRKKKKKRLGEFSSLKLEKRGAV
jgi:hypothetical protein